MKLGVKTLSIDKTCGIRICPSTYFGIIKAESKTNKTRLHMFSGKAPWIIYKRSAFFLTVSIVDDFFPKGRIFITFNNQLFLSSSLPSPLTLTPSLLVMNMTFGDQKEALKTLSFFPPLWIISGILEEQKEAYVSWAEQKGLKLQECIVRNGWIACILKKHS